MMLNWLKRLSSYEELDPEKYARKFKLSLLLFLYQDVLSTEIGEEESTELFTTDDQMLSLTKSTAKYLHHHWPADKSLHPLHKALVQWGNGRTAFISLLQQKPIPMGRVTIGSNKLRQRKEWFGQAILKLGEARTRQLLGKRLAAGLANHFGLLGFDREYVDAEELNSILQEVLFDVEESADDSQEHSTSTEEAATMSNDSPMPSEPSDIVRLLKEELTRDTTPEEAAYYFEEALLSVATCSKNLHVLYDVDSSRKGSLVKLERKLREIYNELMDEYVKLPVDLRHAASSLRHSLRDSELTYSSTPTSRPSSAER